MVGESVFMGKQMEGLNLARWATGSVGEPGFMGNSATG